MFKIQTVAVELAYRGCGDDYAGRVREFYDVEGEEHGLAEGGYEAVVGRSGEGEEVDLWAEGGACYCS
jgi:hypothetical protein